MAPPIARLWPPDQGVSGHLSLTPGVTRAPPRLHQGLPVSLNLSQFESSPHHEREPSIVVEHLHSGASYFACPFPSPLIYKMGINYGICLPEGSWRLNQPTCKSFIPQTGNCGRHSSVLLGHFQKWPVSPLIQQFLCYKCKRTIRWFMYEDTSWWPSTPVSGEALNTSCVMPHPIKRAVEMFTQSSLGEKVFIHLTVWLKKKKRKKDPNALTEFCFIFTHTPAHFQTKCVHLEKSLERNTPEGE